MSSFYQVVKQQLEQSKQLITMVGISGELLGKRWIFHQEACLYAPKGTEVLSIEELKTMSAAGIHTTSRGRLFVEHVTGKNHLLLCGGGHVSLAILKLAKDLEFSVTVVEDREEFARGAKKAGADAVLLSDFSEGIAKVEITPNTYVVIATRGHQHDLECLRQVYLQVIIR